MAVNVVRAVPLRGRHDAFVNAAPFPHVVVENFIDLESCRKIAAEYPTFDNARALGFEFNAVNERKKIQITDQTTFPPAVKALSDFLASPAFLSDLSALTGIPNLLADEALFGGGMHDRSARAPRCARRLQPRPARPVSPPQLAPVSQPGVGRRLGRTHRALGSPAKHCAVSLTPALGRCLVFETSQISFHGVAPLMPSDYARRSFAALHEGTTGGGCRYGDARHAFPRAPDEKLRRYVLMPAETVARSITESVLHAQARSFHAGRVLRALR